jgi:hypothetical protein
VIPFSFRSAAIISRRMTFFILVPDMGHSVTKRTQRGTRKVAILPTQKSMISFPVTVAPGLSWMKAAGMSSGEAYRPVDGAIWVTNSTILRAALRSGSRSGL